MVLQLTEYDVTVRSDSHGKLVVVFGWQFICYRDSSRLCLHFHIRRPKQIGFASFWPRRSPTRDDKPFRWLIKTWYFVNERMN
jgi:hypothetical protein